MDKHDDGAGQGDIPSFSCLQHLTWGRCPLSRGDKSPAFLQSPIPPVIKSHHFLSSTVSSVWNDYEKINFGFHLCCLDAKLWLASGLWSSTGSPGRYRKMNILKREGIFITCRMFYSSNRIRNHSTPSISGGKKSTSGRRLVIMAALPRIRWRDILCTSWLTTSLSSDPVCLAIAAPRRLNWLMAWWCMPPRVSRAIGRKTSPCCLQASAVSRIFRSYAWSRAPPWRAVAAARLELARGLVTVTSRAASFPSLHKNKLLLSWLFHWIK